MNLGPMAKYILDFKAFHWNLTITFFTLFGMLYIFYDNISYITLTKITLPLPQTNMQMNKQNTFLCEAQEVLLVSELNAGT